MYVRVTAQPDRDLPDLRHGRRGDNPLDDAENIRTLLDSAKDESELTMSTDVDRNDKSRICVPGSVKVIGRRQIELYSRLIHTVDHVEAGSGLASTRSMRSSTHMWAVTVDRRTQDLGDAVHRGPRSPLAAGTGERSARSASTAT